MAIRRNDDAVDVVGLPRVGHSVADSHSPAAAASVAPPSATPPRGSIAAAQLAAERAAAAVAELGAPAELAERPEELEDLRAQQKRRREALEANARARLEDARAQRSKALLARHARAPSPAREAFAELAAAGIAAVDSCAPIKSSPTAETPACERAAPPPRRVEALSKNPRRLAYRRQQCSAAARALAAANRSARNDVERLIVPRQSHQLAHEICDGSDALSGALDWIRRVHGPAIALEVEAAGLFRERGGTQRDDWSRPRARRKVALLTFLLMAPHALPRSSVTGSPSDEVVLVTAGVPQTLLVLLLRSAQREPYCIRTLQRDLAEIERCTDLLLRWRTPAAHAQLWECAGEGVVNRYCVRAAMVSDQWRRARDRGEAAIKELGLRLASWLVWRPATAIGSPVAYERGGWLKPAVRPAPA